MNHCRNPVVRQSANPVSVTAQGMHSPDAEGALVLNEAEWRGGQTSAAGR